MIPREVNLLAREHLTDNQRRVFMWRVRDGMSFREIAASEDVARTTVTDTFDAACRKLRAHGVKFTPTDGQPYVEDIRDRTAR